VSNTPVGAAGWWTLAVVAASTVRTVTRPAIDYGVIGYTDSPFGPIPAGLIKQSTRGPDVCLIGTVLVIAAHTALVVLPLLAIVLFGLLR
jgi:hypothetical protein